MSAATQLKPTAAAPAAFEIDETLQKVLGLPEKIKAAVYLYYYEGYSTEEIAKILVRNPSTVRSDLRRGREKLKTILQEGYDFEV